LFQAPTAETKERNSASQTSAELEPQRMLHPRMGLIEGVNAAQILAAVPHSGPARIRQHFAGLQKTIGNQAVLRMLRGNPPPQLASEPSITVARLQRKCECGGVCDHCKEEASWQAKLSVSQPGDSLEQQADRVADAVMRMEDGKSLTAVDSGAGTHSVQPSPELDIEKANEEIDIYAKADRSPGAASPSPSSVVLSDLDGYGQPLPKHVRSFMESRMGYDFSAVRVHADPRASDMAASVRARAFAHRNHVVFRAGEYSPNTAGGRHLLAHELTHTIQQGASPRLESSVERPGRLQASTEIGARSVPAIQRLGDLKKVPEDLSCPIAPDSPANSSTSVFFDEGSAKLSDKAKTLLSSVAAAWHSGGDAGTLRIDGFANVNGPDDFNWRLSCNRAAAVGLELEAPSDGSPGVFNGNLQVLAQGETTEFPGGLAGNRRAVITTSGGAPAPGPACGLTVAGPDAVDRFCAAYVPSDAPSCGVFPAPNITLTASGATAGATVNWSIIQGGVKASIVGPATGGSVTIQGTAASVSQKDVTVQVTDGHCTATHLLTVRQPGALTETQAATSGPTFIQDLITYTVQDQFGNAMDANVCVDETISVCANSQPGAHFHFGDAGTDASGHVNDSLRVDAAGGIPAGLCIKLNQSLTAGGCGPLLNNTILFAPAGITLTHGAHCAAGDPCP
jgi:outer membrane protein OmpA-like peptidoglycan-associated protein